MNNEINDTSEKQESTTPLLSKTTQKNIKKTHVNIAKAKLLQ